MPLEFQRTLVFGNGGSGKTWLGTKLSSALDIPLIRLDDLHWQPGGYGVARDRQIAAGLVSGAAQQDRWIIEGVYGWLVEVALPRATALIWLDLPEAECIANIRGRGFQGGEDQASFDELLKWVGDYRVRTNANSYVAHERIFQSFGGDKLRLTSRAEVSASLPISP